MSDRDILMADGRIHPYIDDIRYDGGLGGDLPLYDQWLENNPHILDEDEDNSDSEDEHKKTSPTEA